jgi:hypothetical protein
VVVGDAMGAHNLVGVTHVSLKKRKSAKPQLKMAAIIGL